MFKLNLNIQDEQIKNLLCCAFEGGSNYWIKSIDYDIYPSYTLKDFQEGGKYNPSDNYFHPTQVIPLVGLNAVIVQDEENKKHRLNVDSIQRGLKVMQEKYPKHFADFYADNADATTGDVFLQCCLFSEVVYG